MAGGTMRAQAPRLAPRAGDAARPAAGRARAGGADPVGRGALRAAAALAAAAARGLVLA